MGAYFKGSLPDFCNASPAAIVGGLSARLIQNYAGDHQQQLKAWREQVTVLQAAGTRLMAEHPLTALWGILLEFPLLRLQRRLDSVAIAGQVIAVIEFKVFATKFSRSDSQQVEDYALDLRDFHSGSERHTIVPILCSTEAPEKDLPDVARDGTVWPVHYTNARSLYFALARIAELQATARSDQMDLLAWDASPYRPVPTIVHAAELLYAGHTVHEIANSSADSSNLARTSDRLVNVVEQARRDKKFVVCFVTGVPGSGKTLTGLNLVHDRRLQENGRIHCAYLSGNTPLVEVLREALARDRRTRSGEKIGECRRIVKTEIQHLMDYLREYISNHPTHVPPENVIVFDEAQRAWDANYGKQKFDRSASEPSLFIEIMSRRPDWAVIVALVGGGQEINIGEGGLREWGNALASASNHSAVRRWEIVASPDVVFGGNSTVGRSLFETEVDYPGELTTSSDLHLDVSVRSYRCEAVSRWVDHTLRGHIEEAFRISSATREFPVFITRSLDHARLFLRAGIRGTRRVGLVASSGARRLRADGLGVSLSANERDAYVHWYLEPSGDIRSSNSLEVTANEYTCQGLELDYVGVCWGGDMLWGNSDRRWTFRELHGDRWKAVKKLETQEFIRNSYRVLLTRSRVATVIWIPRGDSADPTRDPRTLDSTAEMLASAGARTLDEEKIAHAMAEASYSSFAEATIG